MLKENIQKINTTTNLPPEILIVVFSFLAFKDLLTVFRVCKMWNTLAKHDLVWQEKRQKQVKDIKQHFPNYKPNKSPLKEQFFHYNHICKKLSAKKRFLFFKWKVDLYQLQDRDSLLQSILHTHYDAFEFLLPFYKNIDEEFFYSKDKYYLNLTYLGLCVIQGSPEHIPMLKLLLAHGANAKASVITHERIQFYEFSVDAGYEYKKNSLISISKNKIISSLLYIAEAETFLRVGDVEQACESYKQAIQMDTKTVEEYASTAKQTQRGICPYVFNKEFFDLAMQYLNVNLDQDRKECVAILH